MSNITDTFKIILKELLKQKNHSEENQTVSYPSGNNKLKHFRNLFYSNTKYYKL